MSVGLKANVDGSGAIQVGGSDAITMSTGLNATFVQNANLPNTFGFKNRIINGAMMIDQRNAGAAVTVNSNADFFAVDRWAANGQPADGVFTLQQSSTAPSGFVNSLIATVTTVDSSIGASQRYFIAQKIEGLNTFDFGWGTAAAQTVTLSFWVRSSLTGTFGGSIKNSAGDRSYPFSYVINAANTWEQKTVTIAGDTSGTWLSTNGIGLAISWSLGAGSSFVNTAGAWAAGNYFGATGQTNLIATNGATFYITGVQLEKGSTATSFDYRPYGTELQLCQRYFEILRGTGEVAAVAMGVSTTAAVGLLKFVVTKRAAPTMASSATAGNFVVYTAGGSITCSAVPSYSLNATEITVNSSPLRYTTSGSIATNQSLLLMILGSSSDYVSASAEL